MISTMAPCCLSFSRLLRVWSNQSLAARRWVCDKASSSFNGIVDDDQSAARPVNTPPTDRGGLATHRCRCKSRFLAGYLTFAGTPARTRRPAALVQGDVGLALPAGLASTEDSVSYGARGIIGGNVNE